MSIPMGMMGRLDCGEMASGRLSGCLSWKWATIALFLFLTLLGICTAQYAYPDGAHCVNGKLPSDPLMTGGKSTTWTPAQKAEFDKPEEGQKCKSKKCAFSETENYPLCVPAPGSAPTNANPTSNGKTDDKGKDKTDDKTTGGASSGCPLTSMVLLMLSGHAGLVLLRFI